MPIEMRTIKSETQGHEGHTFAKDVEGEVCVYFGPAEYAVRLGINLEQMFGSIISRGLKPIMDIAPGLDDELGIWIGGADKGRLGEFAEEFAGELKRTIPSGERTMGDFNNE